MSRLILPIGISGSGKSYIYNKDYKDCVQVSPDLIREELTGDISNQTKNKEVFKLAFEKQLRDYSKKMYNEAVKIDFPSKRKWAFVLGKNKRETRQLRKEFESRNKIYPYPND